MRAGLVVDNPAVALGIDERAVDHRMDEPAIHEPGDAVLARALRVRRENPAGALILDRGQQTHRDALGCVVQFGRRHARIREHGPKPRLRIANARGRPAVEALAADPLQARVQNGSSVPKRVADPVEADLFELLGRRLRALPANVGRRHGCVPFQR